MNRATRGFGLLLLAMTAACVADVGPPPEAEPPGEASPEREVARAAEAPSSPAPKRAPFSSRVLNQLAARGIAVHGGPEPQRGRRSQPDPESEPERTTVVLPYIVQNSPMTPVSDTSTGPQRYATHITTRWPKIGSSWFFGNPEIVPGEGGKPGAPCSGTLVSNTAVLTAAHCYKNWAPIGKDSDGDDVYAIVQVYSVDIYPRRNGPIPAKGPFGSFRVKKAFWRFSDWPTSSPPGSLVTGLFGDPSRDHDYAVLRLKAPVPLPPTSVRTFTPLPGPAFTAVHYPFPDAPERNLRMYESSGDIRNTLSGLTALRFTSISAEPGSSGGGVFQSGVDGVVGVLAGERTVQFVTRGGVGQTVPAGADRNAALMISPAVKADIDAWIAASL